MNRKYGPWLKSLSALLINISAVWIALAFITPDPQKSGWEYLTWDVFLGILFYAGSGFIEMKLNNE